MSQLNIHKLYESSRRKELKKFETFDKILQRCHNKITLYAENRKTECIYEVPEFIIGVPLYNINELKEYLISSLNKNGFILKQLPPNWIYISWDIENKKKMKVKVEKKREDFRFVEDYNPSGSFILNERALMDMKEKSIKMLNI
jgi:hypothetical protein|tara:strand:- start:436 stop:867 length:432 start_codon:yes stop_codon:yes gene_type:complete